MSEPKTVRVRDVMNDRYIRASDLETVQDTFLRLRAANARCIIVNRHDEHDEYGIVVLSDITRKVIARDRSAERINVYEIMSKPVVSVGPNMNIRHTVRLFERFGIAVAPVIEDGEVLGIVSNTDIVLQGLYLETLNRS